MATDRRLLRNVVVMLVKAARSTRHIFTYLKLDNKFKYTTNYAIQKAIDFARGIIGLGAKATNAPRNTTVNQLSGRSAKSKGRVIYVSYEFKHQGRSRAGINPASDTDILGTIVASSTNTVGEIKDMIMEVIKKWLTKHYEDSNLRSIRSSLKIASIQEE